MPQEKHVGFAGLLTDPNSLDELPLGALSVADNIVFRRARLAEPRPGLGDATWSGGGSGVVKEIYPFLTDALVHVLDGSTHELHWLSDGDAITGAESSPGAIPNPYRNFLDRVNFRGRAYLTTDGGVQWVDSVLDSSLTLAGLPRMTQSCGATLSDDPTSLLDSGQGLWMTASKYVAYRAVLRRDVSAGGVRRLDRSAPSGRWVVENSAVAARAVQTQIPLPRETVAGDIVELYRSLESDTSDPSDSLYLAVSHTTDSTDISNGYVTIADRTEPELLGEALYTNPGQQGIARSNTRPPVSSVVASFKGSVFYGGVRQHPRFYMDLKDPYWGFLDNADATMSNGDFAVGNAQVTNTDTTYLAVGMYVTDGADPATAGTCVPAGTKIVSIDSATAFTMSAVSLATTPNQPYDAGDSINIDFETGTDDFEVVAWDDTDETATVPRFNAKRGTVGGSRDPREMAESLAFVINSQQTAVTALVVSEDQAGFAVVIENEPSADNDRYLINSVTVSHPDHFASDYDLQGGSVSKGPRRGRLMWSKADQAEAVPLGHYVDLGDTASDILRLIATERALYVHKEDGLWAVTGDSEFTGWRVDQLGTLRLLAPRAAAESDGVVYAWTDEGVVMQSGAQRLTLSRPTIGADLRDIERDLLVEDKASCHGAFVAISPTTDEVFVGVPDASNDTSAATLYVFNRKTKVWSTWSVPRGEDGFTAAAAHPGDGLLRFGMENAGATISIRTERTGERSAHDRRIPVVVSTRVNTTITIVAGSGWTPAVGDVLSTTIGGVLVPGQYYVTAVTSATVFDIDTTGIPLGAGEITYDFYGWEAFTAQITWIPKTALNPFHGELWRMAALAWEALGEDVEAGQINQFTVGFSNDKAAEAQWDVPLSVDLDPVLPRPTNLKVKRSHARSHTLIPSLYITVAGPLWAVAGMCLTFEKTSGRHRRKYA